MYKSEPGKFLVILFILMNISLASAQHDAHREAVIEIASGQQGEALERIEHVSQNPSALWRSLTNAYTRAGQTITNEGAEYRRFVIPENNFVMSMLYSIKGDPDKTLEHAKAAVEAGMPFERLLAGPRDAFQTLYKTSEFQDWADNESKVLLHGPMLGNVTHDGASFWVRTVNEARVEITVTPETGITQQSETASGRTHSGSDYTTVVRVEGLNPNTLYSYSLSIDGKPVRVKDPSFKTYPRKGDTGKFRVAYGGGAGYVPEHERMWLTIKERDPLAMLFLGDNVYIDDPEHTLTHHYCYYRRHSRPEWQELVSGRGIYAIWDDHDFGLDDSHGGPEIDDPPWKPDVWEVFTQNWNNPYYGGGTENHGVWFDFYIGDVHFIMLDGRYYRESSGRRAPRVDNPSMLGPVQLAWLKKTLKGSEGTFKILISSVPWAEGTKGGPPGGLDTWDGFSEERDHIYNYLYDNDIEGVVLLSADRHRSDARRITRNNGYDLYDFMSSVLTNYHTHPVVETPGLLFGYNEKNAFGLLHFDTSLDDPKMTFEIVNIDDESIWKMDLNLSQLRN